MTRATAIISLGLLAFGIWRITQQQAAASQPGGWVPDSGGGLDMWWTEYAPSVATDLSGLDMWWSDESGVAGSDQQSTAGQWLETAQDAVSNLNISGLMWIQPAAAAPYMARIRAAEKKYGIPHNLLARLLEWESGHFAADVIACRRNSSAGAQGIAQFMPTTAAQYGVNPCDPASAIDGAGRYLRYVYDYVAKRVRPSWRLAVAGYNAGEGAVVKYKGVPPYKETKRYVQEIVGLWAG